MKNGRVMRLALSVIQSLKIDALWFEMVDLKVIILSDHQIVRPPNHSSDLSLPLSVQP